MLNSRARGRAADLWSDPNRLRWAVTLPMLALAAMMALTFATAFVRHHQIKQTQQQFDAAARQEFSAELEGATRHVSSEVDRLTELMMGITALTAASTLEPAATVDAYLELTQASDRFGSLIGAEVLIRPRTSAQADSDVDQEAPELVLELPFLDEEAAGELDESQQATVDLRAELVAEVDTQAELAPFLGVHQWGERNVTVMTFPLLGSTGPQAWTALIFDSDSFLARAIAPETDLTTELINTGNPAVGQTSYAAASEAPVRLTPDGRLTADASVNVFGTEFLLRSVSSTDFLEVADHDQILVIVLAGGFLGLGLYVSLRTLIQSRATALASAKEANQQRAVLDRRFRASFELAPIGMAELDEYGRILEVNPALCDQIGEFRENIAGQMLSDFVHETDRDSHRQRLTSVLDGTRDAAEGEHRFRRPDGQDTWVHESISAISAGAGGRRSLLVQNQNITAQRHAAWELAQQALHDSLTGLPNRALFLNRLKHALVRATREQARVGVMFIDIDRFKVINDSLGHDMGDQFLMQIAERIGTALRTGDTVARFGGDEFVVLCESVSGESETNAVADRIQHAFSEPFILGETPTYATASIGITISRAGEDSADALLRDADAAMYRAKEQGRNRSEMFDQSMRSSMLARMEIESQLRTALENGQIVMHYQAIVDPATHLPAGYEALIRWNHPEKGLLGPRAFLPVAEEAGLIHLIDSFALRATCEQIASWVAEYPAARNLYVSTNWSARHLGRFVQHVEQVLNETCIDPSQLVIEVTEGFLLEDTDGSLLALRQLQQLGVSIAIDDFGTGYSSLAYLTQFAVDFLKIDQSFVSKLPEDTASAAVIGAIADMAGRLGIKLIAEGVETDEQIEMLATLGAPRLQGYRFAKPRPAADIAQQLAIRSGIAAEGLHDADLLVSAPSGPPTPAGSTTS